MALRLLLTVVCLVGMTSAVTKPTGCSYSLGVFTCDYSVNTSSFDINYPAELTIQCQTGGGGLMTLAADSFTNLGYYNNIRIINCEFTAMPASSFANFGTVNYFSLEGGNMDNVDKDALLGLNVQKDSALPTPLGEFAMIDVDLVPGGLPAVPLDMFSTTTMVTKLTLDNNPFTYIPDNIFGSMPALGQVSMAGINWECTCNNLWWRDYVNSNGISFISPSTCTLPTSFYGQSTYSYYSRVCDNGLDCDGGKVPAVDFGGVTCLTALQITIYVFAILGFFGAGAALGLAIHTKRQIGGAGGAGAKPGGMRPKRMSSNRIKNAPGSKPPNGTARPPGGSRKAFN
ncbi:hypothetical protein BaRGS_00017863 [Batillaria attramentaria]|uniref:Uncharacterized protein n=1 Tax=Batillaria attramentaria TaxID=370345 RepID=A0ABD0KUP9_9CAEN